MFKFMLAAAVLMPGFAFAHSVKKEAVVHCSIGGEFGREGFELKLYPDAKHPDPLWASHVEIDPGGALEYMNVMVWKTEDKNRIEFKGGPLSLVLRTDLPRVNSDVEGEMIVAEVSTVDSFGNALRFAAPAKGAEIYEMFLCTYSDK